MSLSVSDSVTVLGGDFFKGIMIFLVNITILYAYATVILNGKTSVSSFLFRTSQLFEFILGLSAA